MELAQWERRLVHAILVESTSGDNPFAMMKGLTSEIISKLNGRASDKSKK